MMWKRRASETFSVTAKHFNWIKPFKQILHHFNSFEVISEKPAAADDDDADDVDDDNDDND